MDKSTIDRLLEALLGGDQTQAIAESRKLLDKGIKPERIVTEGIEKAMTQLEAKCTVEQFNLLEIMLVGRAAMEVMKQLYPTDISRPLSKGTVVIGALEGDIHDLGKNIVKIILTAKGYRVVDCGMDCPINKIIETMVQESATTIGISGLITSVIPQVRQVKRILSEQGLGHIIVMAGGAALKQSTAQNLNVDFVAGTAFDGLHYMEEIMEAYKNEQH